MTAYFVAIKEKILDQKELDIYTGMAREARSPLATILARYGAHEDVESDPIEGVVLVRFPTLKDAQDWYHGEGYSNARKHRMKGGKYTCILFEGAE